MASAVGERLRTLALVARPQKYGTFGSCLLGCLVAGAGPFSWGVVLRVLLFFVSFAVLTYTGIYLTNDILDVSDDRRNSQKRNRVLASGAMTLQQARWASVLLILAGMATGWLVSPFLPLMELGFVLLNLAYSWRLKHIPYVDLFVNTVTHPLRVLVGVAVLGRVAADQIPVILASGALYLTTNCLKRHFELTSGEPLTRRALRGYSPAGLGWTCVISGVGLVGLLIAGPSTLARALIGVVSAVYAFSMGGYWRRSGRWKQMVVYALTH